MAWTLTTCAAVLVTGGLAELRAAEVTNERPRMLVTQDEVESLRDKCRGPGRTMFEAMKKRADGMINVEARLDNNGRHYLPTYAFANRKEYCYACGDATRSYGPEKLKRFTRQFVHLRPNTFVAFDRVVAGSASYPKTWLLHSIDEPTFPDQGPTFRIEHGGGRLDVWTLLPEDAAANAVGGSGKEYWVDGENYPPVQTRDPEAGAWRVEVKPTRDSASDLFLHVLVASGAHGGEPLPRVKLHSVDRQTATVEIADRAGKATLQFRTQGKTGGHVAIVQNSRTIVDQPLLTEIDLPQAE